MDEVVLVVLVVEVEVVVDFSELSLFLVSVLDSVLDSTLVSAGLGDETEVADFEDVALGVATTTLSSSSPS